MSNCPQLEWRDQIKQTRILKLEYQMRTEEWTPTRSRVEAAQQGRGRLDYFFFCIFFIVIKWTTETSFISSIKYCYLQYLCCLLCNPTTWVNQINTLKARTQWNVTRSKDQFSLTTWTQASVNSEDINNKSISTNIGTQRTYILPRYELTQHKKKQGQPKPCLFCCAQLVLC